MSVPSINRFTRVTGLSRNRHSGVFYNWLLSLVLLACGNQLISAQTTFSGGTGGTIPDATTPGEAAGNTNAGIFHSDIIVTNLGLVTSFNSITLSNLSHPYIGDLVLELTHVDSGTSILFMNRPYKLSATVGWGSGSGLNGTYTFDGNLTSTYNASDSIWRAATNFTIVPSGTYAASANAFTGSANTSYVPVNLNVFAGESISGTWELTIRDESLNDIGMFDSWQFNAAFEAVPEPTSPALIIVSALFTFVLVSSRKKAGLK